MSISDCDQAHAYEVIPIYAFRYALVKRDYETSSNVSRWLRNNWEKISLDDRRTITEELMSSIEGYQWWHRYAWKELLEKIKGEALQ